MLPSLPCSLLALTLVAQPALAQPAGVPRAGELHLELTAEGPPASLKVRLRAGRATTFLFDTPLIEGDVRLQQADAFEGFSLDKRGRMLTVVAPQSVKAGESFRLSGHFRTDDAPADLELQLEVASEGEDTVWVHRRPRTAASLHAELKKLQERNQHLEEQNARLLTAASRPMGLVGLAIEQGPNSQDVISRDLMPNVTPEQGQATEAGWAVTYRTEDEVAVKLKLQDSGGRGTWQVTQGELRGEDGAVLALQEVWQGEVAANGEFMVVVKAAMPAQGVQGAYTLVLKEAEGPRSLSFQGIRFP